MRTVGPQAAFVYLQAQHYTARDEVTKKHRSEPAYEMVMQVNDQAFD